MYISCILTLLWSEWHKTIWPFTKRKERKILLLPGPLERVSSQRWKYWDSVSLQSMINVLCEKQKWNKTKQNKKNSSRLSSGRCHTLFPYFHLNKQRWGFTSTFKIYHLQHLDKWRSNATIKLGIEKSKHSATLEVSEPFHDECFKAFGNKGEDKTYSRKMRKLWVLLSHIQQNKHFALWKLHSFLQKTYGTQEAPE